MLQNIPDKLDASILEKFDLGSGEAVKDKLLEDCFCRISAINTFLEDQHSILVGAKGSGKTAVFTLLKTGHLQFRNQQKDKVIIIPIDEPIEYATISSVIQASLKSQIENGAIRYQFLWEVYILYRTCLALKERSELRSIKDKMDKFCKLFDNTDSSISFVQFLMSAKGKIGLKLDMSNPAFPSPDFYISAEPSATGGSTGLSGATIDIEGYKREIDVVLERKQLFVYILVDNLDDFVAKDDYVTQKMILHGILNCCRSSARYPHFRIKASLRADLFHKLDFSQLGGYDKIAPDVVELIWDDSDIRSFIAMRLAFNLAKTLHLKRIRLRFDEKSLYLPPPEKRQHIFTQIIRRIFALIRMKNLHDESDARSITLLDQSSRELILILFAKDVLHRDKNGTQEKIELFTYLSSHFDLGDGHTTPRISLLFLKNLVQVAINYYRENPDQKIIKRDIKKKDSTFALFKREHFSQAYSLLQRDMIEIFKSCMTLADWRACAETFFAKKGRRSNFSFQAFCNMVDLPQNEDTKALIAYLTHLGVVKCRNPNTPHKSRTYELPLLLQHTWKD
jgi:hypothetical protein